ncbi:hypothetical protein LC087_02850 [Bacillus carboniphilus]|uniref:Molecular chaperone DnaJ n=1 Tax=Bacillus carboniphilus TaxID=86663 RepID=A0ABY9JZY1_9BACI|nr:hypothetical protein [Bacillus carboniphilus]WLR43160.1 hypothetical protein LC087_02850 [Bacillus carboniphilus]
MAIYIVCKKCSGSGKIKALSLLPFSIKCEACKGVGKVASKTFKTKSIQKFKQ